MLLCLSLWLCTVREEPRLRGLPSLCVRARRLMRCVSEFTFRAVQPGCPSGLRVDPPLMAETPNLKI